MSWLTELGLPRLVQLQQACIPFSAAFPDVRLYSTLPYWTNSVALANNQAISREQRRFVYQVTMGLHLAKWSEGYEGDTAAALHDAIEDVSLYFTQRPFLQLYPQDNGLAHIGDTGAVLTGAQIAPMGSETQQERGINFSLQIPVYRHLSEL